jgi:hypothetical protein
MIMLMIMTFQVVKCFPIIDVVGLSVVIFIV